MKRSLRLFLLLIAAAMLLTTAALADIGPKDQLTVKVLHPPEGIYYMDLLDKNEDNEETNKLYSNLKDESGYDPAMLAAIRNNTPEGWHACLLDGTDGPMRGDLTGDRTIRTFGYFGLPETYRILLVTEDGAAQVSGPVTRHVLQSTVTYDCETNTVTAVPLWEAYALQYLSTLLPTLLIEGLVLLLFRISLRRNLKVFLLTNLATQVLLTATLGAFQMQNGPAWAFLIYLRYLPVEIGITAIEAFAYHKWMVAAEKKRITAYAIAANITSYLAGVFLASPTFELLRNLF